jgi:hypothetical protein
MPATRCRLNLTPLETRETPAILIDGSTVLYQDVDGDLVTLKLSKTVFPTEAIANSVLTFTSGPQAVNGSLFTPEQLKGIDLTLLGNAQGIGVTVTANRPSDPFGDGFTNLGWIDGTGSDLGNIIIDGDLAELRAGDANSKSPALAKLQVHSMGRFGTGTGGDLTTVLFGKVGSISVKSGIYGATIDITTPDGDLGVLTVGGSLVGGTVRVGGKIGNMVVGGSLIGGAGADSGSIIISGKAGHLTVKGSLVGGTGERSGAVDVNGGGLGVVKVTGDLLGSGPRSASIEAAGGAVSVAVGGSLVGGTGDESGALRFTGDVGPLVIGHDLVGSAVDTGRATANKFGNVTIGGSLVGGTGDNSGNLEADSSVGTVLVKGDVRGGAGVQSAMINSGAGLGRISILGSVIGGDGQDSASIVGSNGVGGVAVTGNVRGGVGENSARIFSGGRLSGVTAAGAPLGLTVGGSLVAGSGPGSAHVLANVDIGPIVVKGSIDGSAGGITISAVGSPAPIFTDLAVRSLAVTGDVVNMTILAGYNLAGDPVNADAQVGKVTVGGDWVASTIAAGVTSGDDGVWCSVDDELIVEPNHLSLVHSKIVSVVIGGQIVGTPGANDGFGFEAEQIGSLRIGGANVFLTASKDSALFGQYLDTALNEV